METESMRLLCALDTCLPWSSYLPFGGKALWYMAYRQQELLPPSSSVARAGLRGGRCGWLPREPWLGGCHICTHTVLFPCPAPADLCSSWCSGGAGPGSMGSLVSLPAWGVAHAPALLPLPAAVPMTWGRCGRGVLGVGGHQNTSSTRVPFSLKANSACG